LGDVWLVAREPRGLKLMKDNTTIWDGDNGALRLLRAAIWIGLPVCCALFWIAAGVAIINWIF